MRLTMSRPQTRRKCRSCTKFFIPDPRTEDRQHYCLESACRQASKAASQRRWLSKNGNGDHFRGAHEVRRVQLWRKNHPGYWKRKDARSQATQTVDCQRAIFLAPTTVPGRCICSWSPSPTLRGSVTTPTG